MLERSIEGCGCGFGVLRGGRDIGRLRQAMNAFQYRKGDLCCERVPLRRLAGEFGTPLYVYSQGHITGQYEDLRKALRSVDHLICFAVKANSNLAVLRSLAQAGTGFDIVSGGELYRVVQAGAIRGGACLRAWAKRARRSSSH